MGYLGSSGDGDNKARDGRTREVHPATLGKKHHTLSTEE